MKKLLFIVLFLSPFLFISCDEEIIIVEPINEIVHLDNEQYLDITIYNKTEDEFEVILEDIIEIIESSNDLLNKDEEVEGVENIYSINTKRTTLISNELKELIIELQEIETHLEGVTNILGGRFNYLWYKAYIIESLPTEEEYFTAINEALASSISFNENVITINGNANLDLDFIKYSYASRNVKKYLLENDIKEFIFNYDGRTIIYGENPNDQYFKSGFYGIKNGEYKMKNLSMCCAGSDLIYWFTHDGRRWTYISSMVTGIPSDAYEKVFVVGEDPLVNEVLAYTFFNMNIEQIKVLENKYNVGSVMYKHLNCVYRAESLTNKLV